MEKLLHAFLESEQRGMASETPLFSLPSQIRCDNLTHQILAMLRFKQISLLRMCWLVGKILLAVLTFTHPVNRPVEDYFVALHDALQHLVTTLALYDGNCPLCGFTLDMQSLTVRQHGHAARTDKHLLHRWSLCSMVFDGIAGKFTANLRFCTYILFPFLNFMLF